MAARFSLLALAMSAVLVLWVMLTFNSVWVATGLYFSLRFGRPTFAVIATLVTAVILYLGVLTVLAIMGVSVLPAA